MMRAIEAITAPVPVVRSAALKKAGLGVELLIVAAIVVDVDRNANPGSSAVQLCGTTMILIVPAPLLSEWLDISMRSVSSRQ
jgi:hypothetical protein